MDLYDLREEIYNQYIQEYHWMTQDQISDMVDEAMFNILNNK